MEGTSIGPTPDGRLAIWIVGYRSFNSASVNDTSGFNTPHSFAKSKPFIRQGRQFVA
jgi:hypothetical protein